MSIGSAPLPAEIEAKVIDASQGPELSRSARADPDGRTRVRGHLDRRTGAEGTPVDVRAGGDYDGRSDRDDR